MPRNVIYLLEREMELNPKPPLVGVKDRVKVENVEVPKNGDLDLDLPSLEEPLLDIL